MSPNFKGALLMVASMVSFTINDSFIKLTDGAVPLAQLLGARGMIASVMIIALALALGGIKLRMSTRAWQLISLRALTEIGAAYFIVTSLINLPLANVSAILQSLPLTVALGSYFVFGEAVGWRRVLAILIGLCGVLLILRPGPEGFSIWSLYVVMAVICVTARDLVSRALPPEVPSLMVAVVNTVNVAVVFTLISVTEPWVPISQENWGYILGSTIFIIAGYYFSVQVMRVGDVSFIAPFRYTGLLAALTLGLLVFGHWPDTITLLGAGLVVATGMFTLYREYRLKR